MVFYGICFKETPSTNPFMARKIFPVGFDQPILKAQPLAVTRSCASKTQSSKSWPSAVTTVLSFWRCDGFLGKKERTTRWNWPPNFFLKKKWQMFKSCFSFTLAQKHIFNKTFFKKRPFFSKKNARPPGKFHGQLSSHRWRKMVCRCHWSCEVFAASKGGSFLFETQWWCFIETLGSGGQLKLCSCLMWWKLLVVHNLFKIGSWVVPAWWPNILH